MPRPSQAQDQALLAAGRELYAELGCAGLSVRRLAEAAGVNPAMVHYHFGSKDGFLRTLLQQMYEDMYAGLSHEVEGPGDPLDKLQAALRSLARFVRSHRPVIARIWADAQAGELVAQEFMRANAPRHLGLLMELTQAAEKAGQLRKVPPLQRFVFLMGSVVAPLVIAGGVQVLGVLPPVVAEGMQEQALSDAAIDQRIAWAIASLRKES
ncbi:TetR family transcriptional regulator [Pelomonas sp. SE-A7]|uniref:TetR/AcrR family transcriptional regulator n=1 Tax=Pelomonas sp. SE-A7 TaxID=3054953 RepID=UPI00259D2413|nr:TetR family transcriptional regulator [Pelomonas sp. SE-A7]MDM4766934.1 TetR family transcriptional regulator [Pelomonas sp. SE-A7]